MARDRLRHVCQECGARFGKWSGRCDSCGAWNSIVEETPREAAPKGLDARKGAKVAFVPLDAVGTEAPRFVTGIGEFDRVCGDGLVPGSALLVGGDPGIGKSTLLLQAAGRLAGRGVACLYVSGEESAAQVSMRAHRLGLGDAPVRLAAATSVRDLVTTLETERDIGFVVIDSIQTMYVDTIDSAPGTVSQVRGSADALIRLAKRRGFCLVLVGHVTKEGAIAGPRVLEHMVDTVLYFEGERGHQFRILRAIKNRFGPTDEIGVFEMTEAGLMGVANPSELFLAQRRGDVSGAAVFAGIEGTRPLLVEIQALVAPSALAAPRRAVVGWDSARLAMVLAVLEARCGVALAGRDVYLNVAGGLRIGEPAADLAVAAALISAAADRPTPADAVVLGEIGLAGEVRAVGQADLRLREAAKLGFAAAILPKAPRRRGAKAAAEGLRMTEIAHLGALVELLGWSAPTRGAPAAEPARRQA